MLRNLLTTWETWSARNTLMLALSRASDHNTKDGLRHALDRAPEIDPLEALRAATEISRLLASWRWQAAQAALREGATLEQIAEASGTPAAQLHSEFLSVAYAPSETTTS